MAQIRLCTQQMDQMEMHFGLDQREEEELQHQHEENLGDYIGDNEGDNEDEEEGEVHCRSDATVHVVLCSRYPSKDEKLRFFSDYYDCKDRLNTALSTGNCYRRSSIPTKRGCLFYQFLLDNMQYIANTLQIYTFDY